MRESCNYYGPGCCVKQQLFEWKERLLLHMKNYIYICGGSQFTGWDGGQDHVKSISGYSVLSSSVPTLGLILEKKVPRSGFFHLYS